MLTGNTLLLIFLLYLHLVGVISFSTVALSPTAEKANPEYVSLLNHSILFYEAQRSGKLPADNRVPW